MDGLKFCTQCGVEILEDQVFCPKCGHKIGDPSDKTTSYETNRSKIAYKDSKGILTAVVILCAVWAIIAIYDGLYSVITIDYYIDMFKSNTELWDTLITYISEGDLRNIILVSGYALLASGVLAAITAVLSGFRRNYTIALWTCILSSVFGLLCILGIFGFVVVYLITKTKDAYIS